MGKEIVDEVKELKKWEKKGHKPGFPSFKCLQWLYLSTLDGRTLPSDVQEANTYLLKLLKKEIKNQSMYEKAMTAVILSASHQASESDRKKALEYVQSLKEYTVYREEMGRYYDTPRAGYSWYDYKIPTQTMAIEALQRITPNDEQTIQEMQRWLLQSKRTQAWDTPINSVNAVYAFLNGQTLTLTSQEPVFTVDSQPLETPKATAAIGYVKTTIAPENKSMTIEKTSEGTSWGAVYAQFYQPARNIKDSGNGLTVKREVLVNNNTQLSTLNSQLSVGDRIKVRITIEADRDYDFVQIIDRRAACMEPVKQLSGYHSGSYCTPRDNTTNYYFDRFSKGKHVIETEYYIDRPGTYETGSCTVMCAYAPEFRGTTKSQTIIVK
jgi:molybdopterin converting factor small subunit